MPNTVVGAGNPKRRWSLALARQDSQPGGGVKQTCTQRGSAHGTQAGRRWWEGSGRRRGRRMSRVSGGRGKVWSKQHLQKLKAKLQRL